MPEGSLRQERGLTHRNAPYLIRVEGRQMRLGEAGTSPQHKIKPYIRHMVEPSISDNRALKVAEAYPGRSTASQRVYRCKLPEYWGKGINPGPRAKTDTSSEDFIASRLSESPTGQIRLMESICERNNMRRAIKRVIKNKGAPGVDGMTVSKINRYYQRHRDKIENALLDGTYMPMPVLQTEIPKPDGGTRRLGIPTVLDRVIQQAVAQVFTSIWDYTFSEMSFGFRLGRSQHGAVRQYREYLRAGYKYVVDIDISKFFDRVNHDRLMSRLATKVKDKRVLKLIRRFLTSGVMIGGLVEPIREGTPQGGPLSPLLSNMVLDELDKKLEKRGLRFVRYADDCVIKEITARKRGRSIVQVIRELNEYMRGWWNYYGIAESYNRLKLLPHWIRRRLRAVIWKHWKNRRTRVGELLKRGVSRDFAVTTGCARKGPWRMSRVEWVQYALPNKYFSSLGLVFPWN